MRIWVPQMCGVTGDDGFVHLRSGGDHGFPNLDVDVRDTVREKDRSAANGDVDAILSRKGSRHDSYPDDNRT